MRPVITSESIEAQSEWSRLLELSRAELTQFAVWLTRDHMVAEDIVQEALLRAWRARASLRDRASVRAWLFTIIRREHARLYGRKQLLTLDIELCEEDIELAWYDEDPQINELRRSILSLPDEYRIPLIMQVVGGYTSAEIAAKLSLTVNAVLTRLFRARNHLRRRYGEPADP